MGGLGRRLGTECSFPCSAQTFPGHFRPSVVSTLRQTFSGTVSQLISLKDDDKVTDSDFEISNHSVQIGTNSA